MKTKRILKMLLGFAVFAIFTTFFMNSDSQVNAETKTSGYFQYETFTNKDDGKTYVRITDYTGIDSTITFPGIIDGHTVVDVSLSSNKFVEKIILPKSVYSVGSFYKCTNLKEINLENIRFIDNHQFQECTSLKEVNLSSVKTIGEEAFKDCTSLTSVDFGNHTVESIDGAAFANTGLTSLNLKVLNFLTSNRDNYTRYIEGTFNGCKNLSSVTLDINSGIIPDHLFAGCSSLTDVNLSDKITTIGYGAFSGCSSLKAIALPESLTDILSDYSSGWYAFGGCTSLEEITIPSKVTGFSFTDFDGCSSLKKVNLNDGLLSIGCSPYKKGGALAWTFNKIPNTVIYITLGEYKISGLTIPNSVQSFDKAKSATFNYYKDSPLASDFAKNKNATAIDPTPATDLKIKGDTAVVMDGISIQLTANLLPTDTTDAVTWISSSDNIAMVDVTGKVQANSPGQVVIRATSTSGLTADFKLTVAKGPEHLNVPDNDVTIGIGEKFTRVGKVDDDAYDKTILYTSDNPLIATVSNKGVVTGISNGTARITLTTLNGLDECYEVTVKNAPGKITLTTYEKTLRVGYGEFVSYEIPDNTYSSKITFSSSNKKVATVSSGGYVTAKKPGTVKITVKTHNGKKSTITLRVTK